MLNYKGFFGHVMYDDEAKIFHGEVINTRTVITFQGESVREIEQAFKDSVDDYLDWCREAVLWEICTSYLPRATSRNLFAGKRT